MPSTRQTTIQCVQCRQPVRAVVHSLIDAQQEPEAKANLLSGRLNTAPCPSCGAMNSVMTPLLYHDGSKELLISYVPMEMGLSKDAQEKAIGDLMRQLTSNLGNGGFKGYLLQPRQALTIQGLVEQVLQADGVTPEMMEAQRERVRLVEMFIQSPEEKLPALVQEYDTKIDAGFFQTMTMIAQRTLEEGHQNLAHQILETQNQIVELSSYGQQMIAQSQLQEVIVQEVVEAINAIGTAPKRSDFLNLAIQYAESEDRLQALVGLVRQVFDYEFFQEMTVRVGQAPAGERDKLTALREKLLEYCAMIDQQSQMAVQQAAQLLETLLTTPNPDEVIQANLQMFDSLFLQVTAANIQEAERRKDLATSGRLKAIYSKVIGALQANMPPELRFINDVLSAETEADAGALIAQHAHEFDEGLLEALDAVEGQIGADGNPAIQQRLAFLRREAEGIFG
ncbi:MAG: hypothetical protein H6671_14620 [Anaerolineaceae bacterium]|nr:hypothetical protein [Anaerolineaceae bacterium]